MDYIDRIAHLFFFFFFSSRRRHTRCSRDWSSDVCSSDLSRFSAKKAYTTGRSLARGSRAHSQPKAGTRASIAAKVPVNSQDRKSTRLNSSHGYISYAVFCLKKKNQSAKHYQPAQGDRDTG